MGFILWLVIGGVVGWLASLVMKRDASQGIILNIVVGIVGAMLGGWLATGALRFEGGGSPNPDRAPPPVCARTADRQPAARRPPDPP
jgi:uncharacterized membrane protein YeaQ/YmgE (transglycosylase-associated protein family)